MNIQKFSIRNQQKFINNNENIAYGKAVDF